MPSAVVFDVGNVLVDWHPSYLYDKLIPDAAERDAFLRDVVTPEWHFQHDAGRPFAETSAELVAHFPQHRALIEAWGPRFLETIPHRIDGMTEVVADLAARQVPLYAITNFSAEFWSPFMAREADLFAPFRGIVVSGEERLVKPDAEIFRLARARFGLDRGEGVFVDDRGDNVAAAEENGFIGLRFTDAATLRGDLAGLKLL